MHPITAQIRRVPSVSSLFNDDFTWSMGTSQAPTAGVAVLRRFSCLWRRIKKGVFTGSSRHQQDFLMLLWTIVKWGGTLMQSNKHRLTAQKTKTGKKYLRQFLFYSLTHSRFFPLLLLLFLPFPIWFPTEIIQFGILITDWIPHELLHVMKDFC